MEVDEELEKAQFEKPGHIIRRIEELKEFPVKSVQSGHDHSVISLQLTLLFFLLNLFFFVFFERRF
jgi:hypothetical protein